MARFTEGPAACAPPAAGNARRLLRWVCTSNPFYVLSAGLFLAGLRISFGEQANDIETWALMSGLAGYTLLLAVTAFLLVRFCRVWDDVRTVLLLVVLMFLATSVTFDELLLRDPRQGVLCYLAGLLFAVVLTEALLRGLRLRLPGVFRVPYYLILALFFLYPISLGPIVIDPKSESLLWGLFSFSGIAGLVFLTLLPAIRSGPAAVRGNGSPWPWPVYPWALFGLLALAVPPGAFLLCLSMHQPNSYPYDRLIFGPYFLAPFGLALAVLLLEVGLVSSRPGLLRAALAVPLGLVGLALLGHRDDVIYQDFRETFASRLGGDPLYLTLLGSAGFYVYAALRRVPLATEALTASLLALALVGPDALSGPRPVAPAALPILAAAALQLGIGLWQHSSWRCLVGCCGLLAGAALGLPPELADFREPILFHLALGACLFVGALFDDTLARVLRLTGSVFVLGACLRVLLGPAGAFEGLPEWALEGYPLIMAALLVGYSQWVRDRLALLLAGLILAFWLGGAGWHGYCSLRESIKGLDYLALSLALFAVAIMVSLGKAGLLPPLRDTPRPRQVMQPPE